MYDSLTPNPPHVSGQQRSVRADLGNIEVVQDCKETVLTPALALTYNIRPDIEE